MHEAGASAIVGSKEVVFEVSTAYTVNFEAQLPIEVKRDRDLYIASCPLLDVCSQGLTRKKALENLGEALYLFFRSCYERGTLTRVLSTC